MSDKDNDKDLDKKEKVDEKTDNSRRSFLKNSGLALGGLVVGGAVGGLWGKSDVNQGTQDESAPAANPNEALMFFLPAEYEITVEAVERIFPEDDLGPGAAKLNAAIYIDHQLASQWGVNARDYRMGPWYQPEPTQGDQVRLLRQDLFRLGLKKLEAYSQEHYDTEFTSLEPGEQDEVLVAFENGDAGSISGTSTTEFFKLLRQLTMEGVYADPMYGGNNQMVGWSMRKYPGTRMNYVEEVDSEEFIELEPESLTNHMNHS